MQKKKDEESHVSLQPFSEKFKNGDIIRIKNETYNYYISTNNKNKNYFLTSQNYVTFIDSNLKIEKKFIINKIKESNSESLSIALKENQGYFTSVMTCFEIVKLRDKEKIIKGEAKLEDKDLMIEETMKKEKMKKDKKQATMKDIIHSGEPILLKSVVNDMYLAIKKLDQKRVVLAHLEDQSCEFVFVFEKLSENNEETSINFNESICLRSLNGGTISLSLKKDYLESEKQSINRVLSKDDDELAIEETIKETIKEEDNVLKNVVENAFETKKDRFIVFKCERVTAYSKGIIVSAKRFTKGLIEFYCFLQDWGNIGGKELKASLNQAKDFRIVEDSTYYSYDTASKMQRTLIVKTQKFDRILNSLKKLIENNNFLSDINQFKIVQTQDLLYKIKQKALRDINFFELMGMVMRLIIKKLYESLDLSAVFHSKFDTEKKKSMNRYSSGSNSKLKRILFTNKIDWKRVKNTPQHIIKQNVYKILKIILDLFHLGVKNNPENVEILSKYTNDIYYLMSFLPEKTFKILIELAKYKKFKDQNHIVHWIEKLEVVGERKNNIKDQIKYLKILRQFCKDNGMGKDLMRIQKRIRIQLFNIGTNPMKRGVLNFHKDERLGKAIIRIFKPNSRSVVSINMIHKIEPKMKNFRFKKVDNNKLSWDFGSLTKEFRKHDLYKDMISYIEEYIFLMIEMSQEQNDEALNQIKNIGLTKELCKQMILDPSFPIKLKHSLLEMYLKVYMNSKKTIQNFDDLSFCFEKLNQVSLLSRSVYWMNINEIKSPEFLGEENLALVETFLNGTFLESNEEIQKLCDLDFQNIRYFLRILTSVLKFIQTSINFGHTNVGDNIRILSFCRELLQGIFYVPIRMRDFHFFKEAYDKKKQNFTTWYLIVITTAIQIDGFHNSLKEVIVQILNILLTISKIRVNLQVLSFLKMFKVTYKIHRKFQCSIAEFERLFTFYNFERNSSMREIRKLESREDRREMKQSPAIARNKVQQKRSKLEQTQSDIDKEIEILCGSTGVSLVEEIFKVYYDCSQNCKNTKGDLLSQQTKINDIIKDKIYEVSDLYFRQREIFYDYIQRAQVFVGPEEFKILKDFDGDLQAYNSQIVSINRLSEQIEQILLDDVSMKNKLKNMSSKNYELRILELTNILNKILGRLIERLDNKNMFKKTQNFMTILKFHEILIKLFKINYNEAIQGHKTMLAKTIQFFEYYTLDNDESKRSLVPYTNLLINVIDKKLKVARVISHIFSAIKSIDVKKNLLNYLFKKVSELKISIEDILRQDGDTRIKDQREILCEYIKLIRTFMIENGESNKIIQRCVMEHILMNSVLYHFLIPETIEKFKNPDVLTKMSDEVKDQGGLLNLLHEIYCLLTTLISANPNCIMILKGIISEENIRNVISSDKIHLILRKNFIRLYFEAFIVPQFDEVDLLEDHEDIFKFLSYIDTTFLKQFQNSLVWIPEFGLQRVTKEKMKMDICSLVERFTSGGEFSFNYEIVEKYKSSYRAEYKDKGLGRYFWECLAHGEAWSYSFDGVLLILIDLFEVCFKSSLNLLEPISDILKSIKKNLKNLLYSVIEFSDRFEDIELEGFLFILNEAYWMVPLEKSVHIVPIKNYKFRLCLDKKHLEFLINKKALRDKASKRLKREIREKNLIKTIDFNKQLTPDEISELMSLCFIKHLTEKNLQLYQTFNIFVSNNMFDVCSKLRMLFNKYGLKFDHVKIYIDDSVYNSLRKSGENLDVSKIVKKLTKDIVQIQNFGRKKILREQKNKKINLNFEYIQNDDLKAYEHFKPNDEDREFSLNPENIFSDLKKMRIFAKDMISDRQMQCGYSFLIRSALGYFRRRGQIFEFNPFDLLLFFAIKMMDKMDLRSKNMLEMIKFFNLIFLVVETFSKTSVIHLHFERFLDKLIDLELHEILFENFENTSSINILIENLELMINLSKRTKEFRMLVYYRFMNQRDILLHTGKLLIGRGLIVDLYDSLNRDQVECKFLEVTKNYLDFIEIIFEKVNQECEDLEVKRQADKIAFLLLRRLCEFQVTMHHFFELKSTKIFIVDLNFRLTKCILVLLQIIARYIEFTKHHALNSIFSSILNQQLSLSNNLEDERVIFLYFNCIKLLNLLITRFDIEDTKILLDNLDVESIVSTMSYIYMDKIKGGIDSEKICVYCEKLSKSCTFYRCSLGRIPRNVKILRDVGMEIFTVLIKFNILFPNEPKLDCFSTSGITNVDLERMEKDIRMKIKEREKKLQRLKVIDKNRILRKLKMINPLFKKATMAQISNSIDIDGLVSRPRQINFSDRSSILKTLIRDSAIDDEEDSSSSNSQSLIKIGDPGSVSGNFKMNKSFSRANSEFDMIKKLRGLRRNSGLSAISKEMEQSQDERFQINLKEINNTENSSLLSDRNDNGKDGNLASGSKIKLLSPANPTLKKSSFHSSISQKKFGRMRRKLEKGDVVKVRRRRSPGYTSMFKGRKNNLELKSSKSIRVNSSSNKLDRQVSILEHEIPLTKTSYMNKSFKINIEENSFEDDPEQDSIIKSKKSITIRKSDPKPREIHKLHTIESNNEESPKKKTLISEIKEEEAEDEYKVSIESKNFLHVPNEFDHPPMIKEGQGSNPPTAMKLIKMDTFNFKNPFEHIDEEDIDELFHKYKKALQEYNISLAYTYYSKHVQFLQLSYTSMFMKATSINFIKTALFFIAPETAFFLDQETTDNLKYDLIKFPANLRKRNLLKRVSLVISIIKAKQKLFSRKGISLLIKFVPIFRFSATFLIILINFIVLLVMGNETAEAKNSAAMNIVKVLTIISFVVYFFLGLVSVSERILLADVQLQKYTGKLEVMEENYRFHIENHKFLVDNKHIRLKIEIFLLKIFIAFLQAGFLRYVYSLFEFGNLMILTISYLCFHAFLRDEVWPHFFSLFITMFISKSVQKTINLLTFKVENVVLFVILFVAIVHNYSLVIMLFYQDQIQDIGRFDCKSLLTCFLVTAYNSILVEGGGLGRMIKEPYFESENYFKNLALKLSFSFWRTMMFAFFFFGIIIGLRTFREDRMKKIRKMKKECLICGISKEYLDSCGMSWKRHIKNEHNFKKVFWYLIYLLELTKQDASSLETKLRRKLIEYDETIFDDLRVDNLIGSVPDFSSSLYLQ